MVRINTQRYQESNVTLRRYTEDETGTGSPTKELLSGSLHVGKVAAEPGTNPSFQGHKYPTDFLYDEESDQRAGKHQRKSAFLNFRLIPSVCLNDLSSFKSLSIFSFFFFFFFKKGAYSRIRKKVHVEHNVHISATEPSQTMLDSKLCGNIHLSLQKPLVTTIKSHSITLWLPPKINNKKRLYIYFF